MDQKKPTQLNIELSPEIAEGILQSCHHIPFKF